MWLYEINLQQIDQHGLLTFHCRYHCRVLCVFWLKSFTKKMFWFVRWKVQICLALLAIPKKLLNPKKKNYICMYFKLYFSVKSHKIKTTFLVIFSYLFGRRFTIFYFMTNLKIFFSVLRFYRKMSNLRFHSKMAAFCFYNELCRYNIDALWFEGFSLSLSTRTM